MPTTLDPKLRELAANTIRMLAADGVEKADSGHPGMPMGAADYALTLWPQYLQFNPADPPGPTATALSSPPATAPCCSIACCTCSGSTCPWRNFKAFRQCGSKTPGHPEYGLTPGVETSTGPLGQGFANGVGMAIAARMTEERLQHARPPDR